MTEPISHRLIDVFRAVMNTGNLTEAARLLHSSQPTLSRELARLEQILGYALFSRTKGRLQPTARALTLFSEVQRSYQGLDQVIDTARQLGRGEQGQLSILSLPALTHALLPAVSARFLAECPGVQLSITPQESPLLEAWLTGQRFDLGLTEHHEAPPGTSLQPLLLADEVCVLPAGHALLAKSVLTPADFTDQPFVSLSGHDPYRLLLDQVFAERGVERQLLVETHSAVAVCAMVGEGVGLSIINPLTALALAGDRLHVRRFSVSIPYRVGMVLPRYRPANDLRLHFSVALQYSANEVLKRLNG
ncbi:LysR family transcriptional regulator [Chitinimonas sp. BJB300]|uniref:LysR family transcriptional regulator n=1 Tax=Chitinimonas sp. BJB300 TaxID=1559339 RepID=UPI000C111664|nr:LysR family transcriptional regulator [Chitinimonas sp. BJB300]PHV11086.1 LysR family transcriptional regulator [Chitinimonas sp. BJB300]TSJ89696.1 LysR family transcriptional regulator [Chitinimonas sp. BJB300]